jgi:hypothetical protein
MKLTEQQADGVKDYLFKLGARNTLLHELTDHWCVLVNLEMSQGKLFEHAFDTLKKSQSAKAVLLIAEIQELRFPHVVSPVLVKLTGTIALLILITGIGFYLFYERFPRLLLLPGLVLTAYIFLPLWFLRKLHTTSDKVLVTAIFLNLFSFIHVSVVWLVDLKIKFTATISWVIFALFLGWYYFVRKRN